MTAYYNCKRYQVNEVFPIVHWNPNSCDPFEFGSIGTETFFCMCVLGDRKGETTST